MQELKTDREILGEAMGRIPSGCSILTAVHGGKSNGVLVSWVQQASFEPLMLTVCVKEERPAAALINDSGKFLLNVIGTDPSAMFKHFGSGYSLDEDAFAGLVTRDTEYGPALADAIACLGCRVEGKASAGDHDIYIAEVVAACADRTQDPYVHIRKSGLTY